MNMKRLAFSAMAMLSALCADGKSIIVDYFYGEEFYQGTANDCVSPYQSMNYTSPVRFKLDMTKVPVGWHVVDWAVCTKGDLAARNIDNYTMLGIGPVTSYTWTDMESVRGNLAVVFERNGYTVSFNSNGGTGGTMDEQEFVWGVAQRLLPNKFRRNGYKFIGWCLDDYSDVVDLEDKALVENLATEDGSSVTLYAVWEAGYYTVAFNANGGEGTMESIELEYDEPEDLPPNEFTREHHVFAGWNTKANGKGTFYEDEAEVVNLTQDITKPVTLYAQWEPEKFAVKFNANGGEGAMPDQEFSYDETRALAANAYTRPGYTFKNWNTERDGSGDKYENREKVTNLVGEDGAPVTLYAQWTANRYTVKFDANSDDSTGSMADTNYVFGTSAKLPANAFSRPGYTFVEWNSEPSGAGDSYPDKSTGSRMVTEPDDIVTLYAQWRPNKYYVTFYPHGGEGTMEDQEFEYGVPQSLAKNAFTVDGKDFLGWNTKKSGVGGTAYEDREVVENLAEEDGAVVKLYAQWDANSYTVVFDPNGGETTPDGVVTQEFVYGTAQRLVENEYTRFANTFTGWNTEPDGTGDSYADRAVGSRLTTEADDVVFLYAQWRANTYTIKFDAHGGEGTMADQAFEYGYKQRLTRNAFTRAGYDFSKWTTKRDGSGDAYDDGEQVLNLTDEDGDVIVLYAQWSANGYTVKFNKNSEEAVGEMADTNYTFGATAMLPENQFTRYAYTFVEWNTEPDGTGDSYADMGVGSRIATEPGDSVTLYAQWRPNIYFIVFNAHGGEGEMDEMTCDYGVSYRLTRNAFTADGRKFLGWNTKKNGSGTAYAENEKITSLSDEDGAVITLYAQWDANTFTVKFDPNGGLEGPEGPMPDQDFIYGSSDYLDLNTYTNYAHTFVAWNTEPDGSGDSYADGVTGSRISTEDDETVTLFAQWRPNRYTVRFDAHNGTGTMPDQTFEYGVPQNLTKNEFKRDGYVFAGWNLKRNGTDPKMYEDCEKVSDLTDVDGVTVTLYAQWGSNGYNVLFDANCDDAEGEMEGTNYVFGTSARLPANAFTRFAHTFTGWNTEPDGSGTAYADGDTGSRMVTEPGEDVILYAQWRVNTYTIRFDGNKGTGTMPDQTFEYGYPQNLAKNEFVRPGYGFLGWNRTSGGTDPTTYADCEKISDLTAEDGVTITLYAQWDSCDYKVHFDKNEESATGEMADQEFTYGGTAKLSTNAFSFAAHTFASWNTEPDGSGDSYEDGANGSKIDARQDETVTLYAQWRPNTYTVRFNARGGTGTMADQEFDVGVAQRLNKNEFTLDGKEFLGWTNRVSGAFYADRQMVQDLAAGDGDVVTLYAVWNANSFTVAFDANGGEGTMESVDFVYGSSTRLPQNEFTYEHRTFIGWNTERDGSGEAFEDGAVGSKITTLADDVVTLYAQWRSNGYVVRFNANGGSGTMADQEFEYGYRQRLTRNAYTRSGYGFGSWNTKRDGTGTSYADQAQVQDLTGEDGVTVELYAQWAAANYTVHFDGNGGELPAGETMDDMPFTYGGSARLPENKYVNASKTFTGWNTMPDGSGTHYDDGAVGALIDAAEGETVTLYAEWRSNQYTVRFMPGAGQGTMADQEFEVGVAQRLAQNAFTFDGKEFLGWTNRVDGSFYVDRQTVRDLSTEEGAVVRLYAVWNANTFTVKYDPNCDDATGGPMDDDEFAYGASKRLTENAFERANYTFTGWNTAPDGSGEAYEDKAMGSMITTVSEDVVTLYAQWRPSKYIVHFDPHGGAGTMADQEFEYGYRQRLTPNAFTRAGYTFLKWNSKRDGTGTEYENRQNVINPCSEDGDMLVLYAQWTNVSYKVAFNPNGGTGSMDPLDFEYGEAKYLTPNTFTFENHQFVEWNTAPDGSGVAYADGETGSLIPADADETVTLYAQWRWNIYTVRFMPRGGEGAAYDQEFSYNERKQLEANRFTAEGRVFQGWTNRVDGATYADREFVSNLTNEDGRVVHLFAMWDANPFTVVFDGNADGVEGTMAQQEFMYGTAARLNENEFTLSNHTFVAWNTAPDGSGVEYADRAIGSMISSIEGDIVTLYAQWRADRYVVHFDAHGGTGTMNDQEFEYGVEQRLTQNAFTKTGYTFWRWNNSRDGKGDKTYEDREKVKNPASEDGGMLVLYAQWTNVSYTVKFEKNAEDAEGTMSTTNFGYGAAAFLPTNCFTRAGWVFAGWNTEPDGAGASYEDGATGSKIPAEQDETVTLYAQWRRAAYTVKYMPGAGTGTMEDQEFEVGVAQRLSDNAFTFDGREFLGWTNRVNGGEAYSNRQYVVDLAEEDGAVVRLYAMWNANTYWVRFDPNGGAEGPEGTMHDQEFAYGEAKRLSENTYTNANQTFVGWNTAADGSGESYEDKAVGSRITTVAGDVVTLYAQWRANRYIVRFDAHGGEGTMPDQEFEHDYEQRLTQNQFTKTGYTFWRWNSKRDGTGTNYVDRARVTNPRAEDGALEDGGILVLYAQWTNVNYTVAFEKNAEDAEGTMSPTNFGYGAAAFLPTNCFTRAGWVFAGWNTEPDGAGAFYEDGATGSKIPAEQDETVTLYAQWRRAAYTVKYMPGAGTGTMADQEFEVGVAQRLSDNAFTFDGREFLGWTNRVNGGEAYSNRQYVADLATNDGEVVRLYAMWNANTYWVHFDANGGAEGPEGQMKDQEFAYGEAKRLSENTYTNANQTFVGWNTAADGSGEAYEDKAVGSRITTVAGDVVTLYAQWRANRYIVHFDGHGATDGAMEDQEFEHGVSQRLSRVTFSKTGYLFDKWTTKSDGTGDSYKDRERIGNPASEDGDTLTLYAQWTNISYKVKFNPNGGTGNMGEQTLGYGGSDFLDTNTFTYADHAFVEWNTEPDGSGFSLADGAVGTMIPTYDGDTVTLYAQWRWNIYTVRFNPAGGTGTMADQDFEVNERKQLTPNAFTAEGREFLGWTNRITGATYADRQFVMNITNEDGRVVNLYAVWDANPFTVRFDKNDDSAEGEVAEQQFLYGVSEKLNENNFTLSNHTFVAWNTARDGTGDTYADKADGSKITPIEGDIVTLYAQWRLNRYKVRFNPNGGEGEMPDQEFEWGYTQRLSRCAFTKYGAEFEGWATNQTDRAVAYKNEERVGCLSGEDDAIVELYARWRTYDFHVTLDPNGGYWTGTNDVEQAAALTNQTFTYGTAGQLPVNDFFSRTNYTFTGWNTSPDGEGTSYGDGATASKISASENETVTLYAQWRRNAYTVHYDARGGDGTMEDDVFEVGVLPHRLSKCGFSAAGGDFLGWTTNRADRTATYTDQQKLTEDLTTEDGVTITMYAVWNANSYTVVFDPNGGETNNVTIVTQQFIYGTSTRLLPNTYTMSNHVFVGWNKEPDGGTSGDFYADRAVGSKLTNKPDDIVTLFAQWRPNRYWVRFHQHGSDVQGEMPDQEFTHDEWQNLNLNAYVRPGYAFEEWTDKADANTKTTKYLDGAYIVNPGKKDNDVLDLYAQWSAKSYKVHFDPNGGELPGGGTMQDQDFTYGGTTNLTTNAYTKAWHTFVEWNTEPDGTGTGYADGANGSKIVAESGDTVYLYAIWRPNAYTVRFHPRGGAGTMADQEFIVNTADRLSKNLFTADGREFRGWSTNKQAKAEDPVTYLDRQYVTNLATNDGEVVTLYAMWNANTFTVKFDSNSDDANPPNGTMEPTNFLYGTSQRLPTNVYTRTTHKFKEWNTDHDGAGESYSDGTVGSTITTDDGVTITLYAIWRPNIYTVLFAPSGGIGEMEPQDFEYDEAKRLTRNAFVRPGYEFAGWTNRVEGAGGRHFADLETVVNLATEDGATVKLYALWTPNEYTVTFEKNAEDATGDMADQDFVFGAAQKLTANAFSRVGYMFEGWNTEPDGSGEAFANGAVGSRMAFANGLVTLYAQWTPITYTVAFDANNGSGEVTTQEFTYDVMQRLDRNPFTWDGHIFLGWDSIWGGGGEMFADREWVENLTAEDGDIVTLYAQWEDSSYTVVYYPNGGSGIMKAQEFSYGSGQRLTSNAFTRVGHTFKNWNTEADGSGRTYADGAIGSGITTKKGVTIGLYAQWQANTYTVHFDKNDSSVTGTMADQQFTYGEEQALSACGFVGGIFKEWNTSADGSGTAYADGARVSDLTAEDGDVVTLYARWRKPYTVKFDANGGSGTMGAYEYDYGKSYHLASNEYTRVGYNFIGWNTKADGTGVSYPDRGDYSRSASEAGDSVTLYAQWEGVSYKVHFEKADDAATGTMDDMDLTYGEPTNLTANAFALENCVFVEWTNAVTGATNDDCSAVLNLTNEEASVVTLCAVWAATNDITYTIAFDANGGAGTMDSIANVPYGEEVALPANEFTRENFWFVGWTMDDGSEFKDEATVSNLTAKSGTTVTLRAKWADQVFHVEFNPGDADGSVSTQTFTFGETAALYANTYSRGEKFVFMGWSTNRNDGVAAFYDKQPVSNLDFVPAPANNQTITLFALWDDQRDSELSKAMHCDELEWYLVSILTDADDNPITNTDYRNRTFGADARSWETNYSDNAGYNPSGSSVTSVVEAATGDILCAEVATNGTISLKYRNTSSNPYGLVFSYSDGQNELYVGDAWEIQKLPSTDGDSWRDFSCHVAFPEGATNVYLHIGFLGADGETAEIDQVKWTPDLPKSGLVRGRSVAAKSARLRSIAVEASGDEVNVEQDEAVIPGSGKVTAPRTWKTGQTVTWKAVADKGSSFSHWDGAFVNSLGLSRNELRSPSLKFKVPEGFSADDIKAVFVSFDSDSLYNIVLIGSLRIGAPVSGVQLIDDSASYVTATVSGLPSGLKFDAKRLSVTGTPKKSGVFKVKVSAKNASGYRYADTLVLKVADVNGVLPAANRVETSAQAAYHPLTVMAAGDGVGTVTGTGVYADGKKVSISAKPAKGAMFAGWYRDAALTEPMVFASGDFRKASQTVVMPEVRYLYARFTKSGALLDPIVGLAAAGSSFDAANGVFEWRVGVALPDDDGIVLESASLPTCSASGLPAGVKFDSTARRFAGVPTKAGEFSARVKVKNAAGASAELPVKVRVSALDAWAKGSFAGAAMADDGLAGVVQSLSVSAAGKLSGKIVMGDVTYTLSAPSYSSYDAETRTYEAIVLCKSGKTAVTNIVTVAAEKFSTPAGDASVRGRLDGDSFTAWQNVWKDSAWKATAAAMAKAPAKAFELGDHSTLSVSVKFGASGTATAKCLGRSCSAALVPDAYDSSFYSAYFYFPPKAGEDLGFAVWAELEWDGKEFR